MPQFVPGDSISANGITHHYEEGGCAGCPPLVFINSLGTDLRIWDDLVPHFGNDFHTLRYDKRGHGLSDCPPAPGRIRDYTDDLARLLDARQLNDIVLVGLSIGGVIAMDFALTYPRRLSALILCDTAPKIGAPEMWKERIEAIRAHGLAPLGEAILARWFSPEFIQQQPAAYRGYFNMLTRMSAAGYIAACQALRDADLRGEIHRITARTLVVCGSKDISTPPDLVRDWAGQLPAARFEVIEGAGHLACIERPREMAAAIRQFLKENGNA